MPESAQGRAVTAYLQEHRLPLVGAAIDRNASGHRQLLLWGFVATDFGKTDAVAKARRFLGDPDIQVDNRIVVRPELATLSRPRAHQGGDDTDAAGSSALAGGAGASGDSSIAGPQSYADEQYMQQYQQQNQPGILESLLSLLGLAAMVSPYAIGGSTSSGPYFGYTPYYGPYPGYPPYYGSYPGFTPYYGPYGNFCPGCVP